MVLDATVYPHPTHLDLRGRVNVASRSGAMDLRDPADDRGWQGKTRGMARTPREFRKCEISSRQQIEKATVSCSDISRWRMNCFEKWYCGSALWRYLTRGQLLPWMLRDSHLGDQLLELGAGLGAATIELARRAPRVTSLEYDHALAVELRRRANPANVTIIQGDAAALPFPDATFSSAISILMLHHLKSVALQDRTFAEVSRVLRPGGIFLAFDIPDGWIYRVSHVHSTFVPMDPSTAPQRLLGAGLSQVRMESRGGAFLLRAVLAE